MRFVRVGIAGVLLAGAIVVAARGAGAEPPSKEAPKEPPKETAGEWATKAIEALEKGTVAQIAELANLEVHKVKTSDLAKDLELAMSFTKTVQDEAPRRGRENAEAMRVYVVLAQQTAAAMNPLDFRAKRAGAYATIAGCRLLVGLGRTPVFDDWLKAGDLAAQSYETEAGHKDGGAFAADALAWMRVAAGMPAADPDAFQKRADALVAVLARLPDGPIPAVGKATAKLMGIEALLRLMPPPAPLVLKPLLEEVVAILTPHATAKGSAAACALWQEVVTITRSRKVLGMKVDYLLGPPAPQLNLTWQLPIGGRWKDTAPTGADPEHIATLEHRLPDGRVLHRIGVRMYRWEKHYGGGEFPMFKGDSTKELINWVQALYKKIFTSITSQRDVAKRELADGMPAHTFEIEGTSGRDSELLSVRAFVVRGKETRGTFLVDALTFGKAPPGDPELDAVLKSFREVKGGK